MSAADSMDIVHLARMITEAHARISSLEARVAELERALRFYVETFPAFCSKPVGAPGSVARQAQNIHIVMEAAALAALEKTK